ncbi:MAG: 30S ribosome-binding factor RbfA [Actinomycetota bacterium]|nr:30S ribosome-binding factor RbfA [Actinomycetota bacterium]
METSRTQRVGELIKEEISDIIHKELKDPRIGFVTITGVDVTPDLRIAKVYISVLGNREQKERTLSGLQSSSGFIRKVLSKRIKMKHFPELRFVFDPSIEAAMRIEKVIARLRKKEQKKEE